MFYLKDDFQYRGFFAFKYSFDANSEDIGRKPLFVENEGNKSSFGLREDNDSGLRNQYKRLGKTDSKRELLQHKCDKYAWHGDLRADENSGKLHF